MREFIINVFIGFMIGFCTYQAIIYPGADLHWLAVLGAVVFACIAGYNMAREDYMTSGERNFYD